jgi:Mn2+/Fe2+ NRAMP family transporter
MGSEETRSATSGDTGSKERQLILNARTKGPLATLSAFVKLSGPGWLQSAITLGGGSLGSSLFLGVLGGLSLLWLQPLAMIMGIIMLSAIAYVTLSTGERPFDAINKHVNPVLGWGWALATLMANVVWCLPQFSLGTAAVQQNLLPNLLGAAAMPDVAGKLIICVVICVICTAMVWSYNSGGRGVAVFSLIIKLMVGAIVLSFFGVVVKMAVMGKLSLGAIGAGLIPNLKLLSQPAATFEPFLAASNYRDFWQNLIVAQQRDVMISAAATAVGINMTFLLPYSLLKRGWDKTCRGLAIFDLSTGLFIPFILATGCVVIAAATQFHTKYEPGLLGEPDASGAIVQPAGNVVKGYNALTAKRVQHEVGAQAFALLGDADQAAAVAALPRSEKVLSAMLVKRNAFNLAASLSPLTGQTVAQYVFGFGVLGMAVSSIIILMLINGFTICEIFRKSPTGKWYRIGSLIPLIGVLGPFFWKDVAVWLVMPTSVFGMMLLPIAYFTFLLMMNSRSLLGDNMPTGFARVKWNVLMITATGLATFGSIWSVWNKAGVKGMAAVGAFAALAMAVHIIRLVRR